MRITSTVFALGLALPSMVRAAGKVIVVNQCDGPLYLWSVGGSIGPEVLLNSNDSYSEPYHVDLVSGGLALTVSTSASAVSQPNISQAILSYSLEDQVVVYNLSQVYSDLRGRTYQAIPSDPTCESLYGGGSQTPVQGPNNTCSSTADITYTFCPRFCLSGGSPCGNNAPGETRFCCTHCIGSHHCIPA